MHPLHGPSKMSISKMFSGFYAVLRWFPQSCKIGSLLYIACHLMLATYPAHRMLFVMTTIVVYFEELINFLV
jgi:hypothetical protein